jgi:hypothetical protein
MAQEMEQTNSEETPQEPAEEQTRGADQQGRVRVDIDERNLRTSYANGFRTTATEEELVLDFGLNHVQPSTQRSGERKMVFQANERIIMSYYSAKRLAIALGQIVSRHERDFGELEMDSAKRRLRQTS